MFLNETLHPKAADLFSVLAGGVDNYDVLTIWRIDNTDSEEQAAELYAHIEDAFNSVPVHTVSRLAAVSMLSRCLWKARVH